MHRPWETGKALLFDDSYEHEVWYDGPGAGDVHAGEWGGVRVVLIVDLWHPQLVDAELRERVRRDFGWSEGIPYAP